MGIARFLIIFPLIGLLLFTGCDRDENLSPLMTPKADDPVMSAQAIEVFFSDSGIIEVRLTSPLLNKFSEPDPRMEFPKGFNIYTFDSAGRVQSSISANYGIRHETTRIMEATGNVIVRNEKKNEQLNTEQLIWDEPRHTIYSQKKVRITTPGKILFGDGIESDEEFSHYVIKKPTGQMTVKQDSL